MLRSLEEEISMMRGAQSSLASAATSKASENISTSSDSHLLPTVDWDSLQVHTMDISALEAELATLQSQITYVRTLCHTPSKRFFFESIFPYFSESELILQHKRTQNNKLIKQQATKVL